MKFYELQQKTGHSWMAVGFFLNRKNAEEHLKEFNTKTEVKPLRITKREFLDFGDFESIKDFIK
jgi:hypothetical protein